MTDTVCHYPQNPTRALEAWDSRPIVIEAIKYFRMYGIACFHSIYVALFRDTLWIVSSRSAVHACKGFTGLISFLLGLRVIFNVVFKQASAYNLKCLMNLQRFPDRLNSAEKTVQSAECLNSGFIACFNLAFRQCNDKSDMLGSAD